MPPSPSASADPWPFPFPAPPRPDPGPVPPIVRLRLRLRRRRRNRAVVVALALLAGALGGAGWSGSGPLSAVFAPVRALAGTGRPAERAPADAAGDPPGPDSDGTAVVVANAPATATPSSPAAGRLGLRPGERAVALAAPAALPPIEPGDEVELVAVAVDELGAVEAQPLGATGRVLAVGDDAVTVALPAADAVAALRHQAEGPIELILR